MPNLPPPPENVRDRENVRRRGLHEFVRLAWSVVVPAPFVDNWHIGAMCEFLQACQARQIRKGVINVPPGCSKTLVVNVLYPAWCWTLDPTERFLCASYEASTSEHAARLHRDLVSSAWYKDRWGIWVPQTSVKKVQHFTNNRGGFRLSTSIGGRATGWHAHQRIIDDPIKPADTMGGADDTRKRLHACMNFFRGTWSTRTADPERIEDIIIMQRLHDLDLAGQLLAEGGVEHLMLPMRYEPKRATIVLGRKLDPRTEPGELLCPERFPESVVKQLELDLGPFASAQLQQDPVEAAGAVFKREWVQYWTPDGKIPGTIALPAIGIRIQSWDMAFKGDATSDYVVGQCWGRSGAQFFLLDQVRERLDFGATVDTMVVFSTRNPKAFSKYIEDKANGPAVITLMGKHIPGLTAVTPEGGKEARANAVAGLWRAGNVFLPHPTVAPWVTALVDELCRFPRGAHDDQVDAMSQALTQLAGHSSPLPAAMKALQRK